MNSFYIQKYFLKLSSTYSLGLYFFYAKKIGAKAASKMLVKLTTGHKFVSLKVEEAKNYGFFLSDW